jgi:hypothetical protein
MLCRRHVHDAVTTFPSKPHQSESKALPVLAYRLGRLSIGFMTFGFSLTMMALGNSARLLGFGIHSNIWPYGPASFPHQQKFSISPRPRFSHFAQINSVIFGLTRLMSSRPQQIWQTCGTNIQVSMRGAGSIDRTTAGVTTPLTPG